MEHMSPVLRHFSSNQWVMVVVTGLMLIGGLIFLFVVISLRNTGYAGEPCGVRADVAYIHLAQFEPALGGMPSAVEIYYMASDGTAQVSSEMTDDRIQRLETGRVSIELDFFDRVFNYANAPSSFELPESTVFYDASPARTRLLVCLEDSTSAFWEGDTDRIPASINQVITLVKETADRATPQTTGDFARFIRVRQMSSHPSQLPRRSYIVPGSGEVEPGGLLANAIKHPYRLIPVSDSDDPPFAHRRQPERPVSAVIQDAAYRIHFLRLYEEE